MVTPTAELRQHFEHVNHEWKNGHPHLQARVRTAYNAWFRAACKDGNPPDALVRRNGNEKERFMERVIVGLDGHSYWPIEGGFVKNDGRTRNARLWWWEHLNGPLEKRAVVKPICGEPHCITPEHQEMSPWSDYRSRYTEDQYRGALQVAALRVGRSPTMAEYEALGLVPSAGSMRRRFSSWNRALAAAGLPPSGVLGGNAVEKWSADGCLDALRDAAKELGHPPSGRWWDTKGRQPSRRTIQRRFSSFDEALRAAGLA